MLQTLLKIVQTSHGHLQYQYQAATKSWVEFVHVKKIPCATGPRRSTPPRRCPRLVALATFRRIHVREDVPTMKNHCGALLVQHTSPYPPIYSQHSYTQNLCTAMFVL